MSSAVEDVITVTSESPLLDEKAIRTGNTVSQNELQKIPTARDPWTVLQSTPGVLVDRVNVGGNESGQQSFYTGPGSFSTQSVWSVDGVVITDMSALGCTPAYFDFDSFEEMQISTGGSDVTIGHRRRRPQPGDQARHQRVPRLRSLPAGPRQHPVRQQLQAAAACRPASSRSSAAATRSTRSRTTAPRSAARSSRTTSGLWGSYGEDKVSVQTLPTAAVPNGETDKTQLPAWNAKLNAQITSSNSATLVGFNSAKQKTGRNAGPTRPAGNHLGPGPVRRQADADQGRGHADLQPQPLPDGPLLARLRRLLPDAAVAASAPTSPRPSTTTLASGTTASSTSRSSGRRSRKRPTPPPSSTPAASATSSSTAPPIASPTAVTSVNWQGGGLIFQDGFGPGVGFLALSRAELVGIKTKYTSGYAQDTLTTGNLTANLGLRYDRQSGDNLSEVVPANSLEPSILPAQSFAGGPIGFTWTDWSPRVGLTYALGKDRSTLLRASYSRFADQLGSAVASALNPLGTVSYYYAGTTYNSTGLGLLTPGQIQTGVGGFYNAAAAPNGNLSIANKVSSNFNAPLTDEFLISAEHALLPEFVVGVNLTYRLQHNLIQEDLLVFDPGFRTSAGWRLRNDFVADTQNAQLPNGSSFRSPGTP